MEGREFVMCGSMHVRHEKDRATSAAAREKPRHVFLFTDLLLLTKYAHSTHKYTRTHAHAHVHARAQRALPFLYALSLPDALCSRGHRRELSARRQFKIVAALPPSETLLAASAQDTGESVALRDYCLAHAVSSALS